MPLPFASALRCSCKTPFEEISLTLQYWTPSLQNKTNPGCSDKINNGSHCLSSWWKHKHSTSPFQMYGWVTNPFSFAFVKKNFTQMQIKIKLKNLLRIPWLLGKQSSHFDSDFDLVSIIVQKVFFVLGV